MLAAVFLSGAVAVGMLPDPARAQAPIAREPITIAADVCTRWQEGGYDVWHLQGNCYLNQGLTYARGAEAVVWIDARQQPTKVIAYFESGSGEAAAFGSSQGASIRGTQQASTAFHRLETTSELRWMLPAPQPTPQAKPAIYERGLAQFNPDRRRQVLLAQYNELAPGPAGQTLPPGMRKFEIYPRSDSLPNLEWNPTETGEHVGVASGGIRMLIEGLPTEGLPDGFGPLGVIDISTDRAVIWTSGIGAGATGSAVQSQDAPLEIYMEGNIEFRQGDRVVYADRMFYDVKRKVGVILNAEMLTPLPAMDGYKYPGLVRLKAAAIRQLDEQHFAAHDALVTTSRLEEPAYDFSSREIAFQDIQRPVVDPLTGETIDVDHQMLAESRGNTLHLRGIPAFYWPTIATDLTEPSFFIDRVKLGNDSIFGTQVMVDFDAYQLFGIRNKPAGTDWGLSTDYLSDRGLGFGTDFEYNRPDIFGIVGPTQGKFDFWAIKDDGLDNLGRERHAITPEEDFRYHLRGQHRQRFETGWDVTGEVGLLSDRTFEEQFFEGDWDQLKDARTGLRAKRLTNNRSLSLEANVQVNDFFTETQELPRIDHYWLGQPLLDDRLTWFSHLQASYSDLNVAEAPTEPTLLNQFRTLPGEPFDGEANGERLIARQELDLPLQAGAVKVTPFVMGQFGHWGESEDGSSLDGAYGAGGVRSSLPMWAVYPNVRDPLFNLNGLAHKVTFDAEFYYADSNTNFDELPLYDPLDDTNITEFRRRVLSGQLGPAITDPKFDRRTYAIRSGMQSWVTSPSAEIFDDLTTLRLGVRQRLQTKRGVPGNQHIVDWMTFDVNATVFPDPSRDNFGSDVGLIDYDFRWHLGDRLSFLSDGAADVFGDGLTTFSAGFMINRPTRGNGYVGLRTINGPVTSNVLLGSYSYRLSEKWITTASAAYDFDEAGSIGQTLSATRIGESMFMTVGFNVDNSKDNVGLSFMLEPRFLPKTRLTRTTGIDVPPPGAFGLE